MHKQHHGDVRNGALQVIFRFVDLEHAFPLHPGDLSIEHQWTLYWFELSRATMVMPREARDTGFRKEGELLQSQESPWYLYYAMTEKKV